MVLKNSWLNMKNTRLNTNRPAVSVIIPVYNVEKYLDRCMQSVLNQTLRNIEIILIDDGSPDDCPRLCDEYANKDDRIKVIHKQNGGLGYARNSGLEIATGEYVAFVDSDDFIDVQMYKSLYSMAKKEDADAVYSNCKLYRNGVAAVREDVKEDTFFRTKDEVEQFLLDYVAPLPEEKHDVKYMMSVWRAVYRMSIIKENNIRFLSERDILSEDMPFNIDFLKCSTKVVYLKDAFYNYCLNPSSLTQHWTVEKNDKRQRLFECIEQRMNYLPDYELHFQRFIIMNLRHTLSSDRLACYKQELNWKRQFQKRLNESPYSETLSSYPIKRMPSKFRFYYGILRTKKIWLIKLLIR